MSKSGPDINRLSAELKVQGILDPVRLLRTGERMSGHTTMRVGGPARIFAEPENEEEAIALVIAARRCKIPYMVIGNGSNLVISDRGIDALVICFSGGVSDVREISCTDLPGEPADRRGTKRPVDSNRLFYYAQAGALLSSVAARVARAGGAGMEFAGGIPGSIGGAVYMNAGAYGSEIADVTAFIRVLDPDGIVRNYRIDQSDMGYRSSRFSKSGGVVLSVFLMLSKDAPEAILERMSALNAKRCACQPLNLPSSGSAFKRPCGHYAGALIEQAGLKGFSIGGAQVSEKHAGFIVNSGDATAQEVYELSRYIIRTVREQTGVTLEPEICFLGFDGN